MQRTISFGKFRAIILAREQILRFLRLFEYTWIANLLHVSPCWDVMGAVSRRPDSFTIESLEGIVTGGLPETIRIFVILAGLFLSKTKAEKLGRDEK